MSSETKDNGREPDGRFAAGNPGRPPGAIGKTSREVKAFLAEYREDLIRGMLDLAIGRVIMDPLTGEPLHNPDTGQEIRVDPAKDEKVRFWAQQECLNRLDGKPRQMIEVSSHTEDLNSLLDAQDQALLDQHRLN